MQKDHTFLLLFDCSFYLFATVGSQKQETKLGGGASRHCFSNLKPNTEYKISIYSQLQDGTEGPAVTANVKTCKKIQARKFKHFRL